ncbi:MAG: DUF6443 domain-containing protein, partial [Cyclobacteriaceae bacterium]
MKACLVLLSLILFTLSLHAQTINTPVVSTGEQTSQAAPADEISGPGLNLIREYTPRHAYTDHVKVVTAPGDSVMLTTSYLDGLGRQTQTVQRMVGPGTEDLIQHVVYDDYGRATIQMLPYADLPQNLRPGAFRHDAVSKQFAFYQKDNDAIANTWYPYAKQELEQDLRSRPLKTGAPGEAWHPDNGHAVEMAYRFNTPGEVAIWRYNFTTGLPGKGTDYEAATLRVVETKDENKHRVEEYTDLYGRTILKKVEAPDEEGLAAWATTRYVYDSKGLLRAVFPPELCKALDEEGRPLTEGLLDKWAFRYRYDARGRMTAKRIPGKDDWDLIVYNRRDLPVLTQDPVQRDNNQWSFTKYDHLNRPIMTGTVVLNDTEQTIRQLAASIPTGEIGYEEMAPGYPFGYTRNQSWPDVSNDDIESVTWFDDYDYPCSEQVRFRSYTEPEGQGSRMVINAYHPYPTGQVTGTAVRNPFPENGNEMLYSATFYDGNMRPVYSVSDNALGGNDRMYMTYSWAGEVLKQVELHSGHRSVAQVRTFTYDHTGRLLQTDHVVDAGGSLQPVVWTQGQNVDIYGELITKNGSTNVFDAGAKSEQR